MGALEESFVCANRPATTLAARSAGQARPGSSERSTRKHLTPALPEGDDARCNRRPLARQHSPALHIPSGARHLAR